MTHQKKNIEGGKKIEYRINRTSKGLNLKHRRRRRRRRRRELVMNKMTDREVSTHKFKHELPRSLMHENTMCAHSLLSSFFHFYLFSYI